MTSFFSEKLRIVSFVSITIVLYFHAGYPDEVNENMTIPVIVRSCIAGVFGPCAVPMFYAISGFLFFSNINSVFDILKKMRKRVQTLVIPFLIAALFYPFFFIIMEFIPGASAHINSDSYIGIISSFPIENILLSLFYDSGNGMPWAYHLWFLRDLIIIIAIMPFVYYIRKWTGIWSLVVVLLLYISCKQISFLYALFWFIWGSFILDKLYRLSRGLTILMSFLFIAMATYHQFYDYEEWKYIRLIEISLGLCSLWRIYNIVVPKDFKISSVPALNFVCSFTFFLYLYHEPAFHIVVKGIPLVFGENEFGYTMSFLFSPIIFIPICISFGFLLKKYTPRFYSLIVGGR